MAVREALDVRPDLRLRMHKNKKTGAEDMRQATLNSVLTAHRGHTGHTQGTHRGQTHRAQGTHSTHTAHSTQHTQHTGGSLTLGVVLFVVCV